MSGLFGVTNAIQLIFYLRSNKNFSVANRQNALQYIMPGVKL
jgi:hypothetical protein